MVVGLTVYPNSVRLRKAFDIKRNIAVGVDYEIFEFCTVADVSVKGNVAAIDRNTCPAVSSIKGSIQFKITRVAHRFTALCICYINPRTFQYINNIVYGNSDNTACDIRACSTFLCSSATYIALQSHFIVFYSDRTTAVTIITPIRVQLANCKRAVSY